MLEFIAFKVVPFLIVVAVMVFSLLCFDEVQHVRKGYRNDD